MASKQENQFDKSVQVAASQDGKSKLVVNFKYVKTSTVKLTERLNFLSEQRLSVRFAPGAPPAALRLSLLQLPRAH